MRRLLIILAAAFSFLTLPAAAQEDPLFLDGKEKEPAEVPVQKGLKISGLVRNDAGLSIPKEEARFSDILEGRLIFDFSADTWKLYGDGRIYAFFGDAAAPP